jgi:adenosine deaminase
MPASAGQRRFPAGGEGAAPRGYDVPVLPVPHNETLASMIQRLPKVPLHDHLDGGLRPATLFELLHERGLPCPADSVAGLEAWFDARAHAGSLEKYLEGFGLTVAAMATPQAIERVAYEAAMDARAEHCAIAEFRIAPLLFEPFGLSGEQVVEAILAGFYRCDTVCSLIVCAMRDLPVEESLRAARLALKYHGKGVVGFDLAGAEAGHPPSRHKAALNLLRDQGMPFTLHAGEADAAERVIEAAHLGAQRIGHGVRLVDALDDPKRRHLIDQALEMELHLEVCPTSNVHTGAASSIAQHPIARLWEAGISLSFHCDNRLMSRTSMNAEIMALLQHTPLTIESMVQMGVQAARYSFMHREQRLFAVEAILSWAIIEHLPITTVGPERTRTADKLDPWLDTTTFAERHRPATAA